MDDTWMRIVENIVDRVSGPMKFRVVLQPLMAVIFAIIAGLKDAKAGKPPYFWGLFNDPAHRTEMLADGWKSVAQSLRARARSRCRLPGHRRSASCIRAK